MDDFREYPLLNSPNLITLLLRAADDGGTTVPACAARLQALLDRAGEHPPVGRDALQRRLAALAQHLEVAGLIASDGETFALTGRGREALAEHPQGFATAELMDYPDYAAVAGRHDPGEAMNPHSPAYDAGFAAALEGRPLAANPHPEETVDHLAWENGWSEAAEDPATP